MDSKIKEQLVALLGEGNVLFGEPMGTHTTFRIGGPADAFVSPGSFEDVRAVADLCRNEGIPLYVVGCGSNLLIADEGLRGVVMRIGSGLAEVEVREDGTVTAQAGAKNSKIARAALDAGLAGFEFAAGIPGSIGGAAIMNAGAYGGELKDIATGVTCLTPEGEIIQLTAEQAQWGYRRSMMGDAGHIVLSVDMQLEPDDKDSIKARMDDLAQRRIDKQPLDLPSAGSTFKRPEGYFAGKLVQDSGMQGHSVGGAQVSTKHAGFVVNTGGATASDVLGVIRDVQRKVRDDFGVELEPEVRMWGFSDDA